MARASPDAASAEVGDFIAGTSLETDWPVGLAKPRWGHLSAARSDLDRSLVHVDRARSVLVQPLLESIDSIEKRVTAFEDGRLGTVAYP